MAVLGTASHAVRFVATKTSPKDLGMGRRDKPGDDAIFINDDICLVF
jgi:hypothetical protein